MNRVIPRIFALLVIFVFVSSSMAIMPAHAANISTAAILSVGPNPGGQNQPLTVSMWVTPSPPTGYSFTNSYWVGIRDPDGIWTVMGPYSSQVGSGFAYFTFVPTKLGSYLFTFNYTGNTIGSDTYLFSMASPQLVTVNVAVITSASLSVSPNPSTVGYPLTLNGQISPPPPSPNVYSLIYVNVTAPSGSITTIGPYTSDASGQMQAPTYTPTASGTYHFRIYKHYETLGGVFYAACYSNTVDVNVPLPSVSILPGSVTLDVGQSQQFTFTFSGMTGPVSNQWYLDSSPVSTASAYTYTALSVGSHSLMILAFDSYGASATHTVGITVNTLPSVSISPSSATLDVGQSQLFSESVWGGTLPFSYQWYVDDIARGTSALLFFFDPATAADVGSHHIDLRVTDATGASAWASPVSVTVNEALGVSISPSSWTMDVGQSKTFTAVPSGGSGTYTGYQWYVGGVVQSGATSSTFSYSAGSVGSPLITVTVTDSLGATSAQSLAPSVTVNAALGSFSVTPAGPLTLDAGQVQVFSASTPSGGSGALHYQWHLDGGDVSGQTGTTYSYTAAVSGSPHSVSCVVTDSASSPASVTSNTVSVTVNEALGVILLPGSWTMDVGQTTTFHIGISYGTPPFSFKWYLDGGVVPGATISWWDYVPSGAGSHSVYMVVTDATGASATSNTASVTVNPALTGSGLLSPSSVTMDVGQSQLFSHSISGGTLPYSYQWYLDGIPVSGATSATWTYVPSPSSVGSHILMLHLTDSSGVEIGVGAPYITVNLALGSVSVTPAGPLTLDNGQIQIFSASTPTGGSGALHYQWYLDGGVVSGETGTTYSYTAAVSGSPHSVSCVVTDSASLPVSVTSNIVSVSVNAPTVGITVISSPSLSGSFYADGVLTAFPHTFDWAVGSSHTLEAVPTIAGARVFSMSLRFGVKSQIRGR